MEEEVMRLGYVKLVMELACDYVGGTERSSISLADLT
jgi:hypothetical protein